MKNKNIFLTIISGIILIGIIIFLLNNNNIISLGGNNDIKKFNNLTQENPNINICYDIIDSNIKEKCIDNYYSILAFEELNESYCDKIKSEELKELCKKEILKFKN